MLTVNSQQFTNLVRKACTPISKLIAIIQLIGEMWNNYSLGWHRLFSHSNLLKTYPHQERKWMKPFFLLMLCFSGITGRSCCIYRKSCYCLRIRSTSVCKSSDICIFCSATSLICITETSDKRTVPSFSFAMFTTLGFNWHRADLLLPQGGVWVKNYNSGPTNKASTKAINGVVENTKS